MEGVRALDSELLFFRSSFLLTDTKRREDLGISSKSAEGACKRVEKLELGRVRTLETTRAETQGVFFKGGAGARSEMTTNDMLCVLTFLTSELIQLCWCSGPPSPWDEPGGSATGALVIISPFSSGSFVGVTDILYLSLDGATAPVMSGALADKSDLGHTNDVQSRKMLVFFTRQAGVKVSAAAASGGGEG